MSTAVLLVLFFVTILCIVWNKMPRSIVALFGAIVMIFCGEYFHVFTQHEALRAIDFNTIGLLIGMMIIVTTVFFL